MTDGTKHVLFQCLANDTVSQMCWHMQSPIDMGKKYYKERLINIFTYLEHTFMHFKLLSKMIMMLMVQGPSWK